MFPYYPHCICPVVARVSIAWYYASKREALWHFYFRGASPSNNKIISYERACRNRKLNKIFNRHFLNYSNESDSLHRQIGRGLPDTTQLDVSWQKLIEFAERYPEFEDKLPENINLNLALSRAFFSFEYWCVECIEDLHDFIEEIPYLFRGVVFALDDFIDAFVRLCGDIAYDLHNLVEDFNREDLDQFSESEVTSM